MDNKGLFLFDLKNNKLHRILAIDEMNYYPSYNSKIDKICYVVKDYIFTLDLKKMEVKKLYKIDGAYGLDWSPNGEKIIFSKKMGRDSEIWIYNTKENKAILVLDGNKHYYAPKWYDENTFSCMVEGLSLVYKLSDDNSAKIVDTISSDKIWAQNGNEYVEKEGEDYNCAIYYTILGSKERTKIDQNGQIFDIKWKDKPSDL